MEGQPDSVVPPSPQARLFYARTFALVALGLLGWLGFLISQPFLAPLAWAAIIAFLLHPLHVALLPRFGGRANLLAGLLTIGTIIFIVLPLIVLFTAFAAQAIGLLRSIEASHAGRHDLISRVLDSPLVGQAMDWFGSVFAMSAYEIDAWWSNTLSRLIDGMLSLGGKLLIGAVGTASGFLIMIFVLFFVIRDGTVLLESVKALVPMSRERTDRLFAHVGDVLRAVVLGALVTALIQGALVGLALWAIDIPAPVVFGAVAALLALLPVGGPSILWVPVCLYLLSEDRWLAALGLALYGLLLVSTIDNVLRPLIVSSRAHIGTLLVFIGVLGGAAAFGMIGLVVGPVILAILVALQRFAIESRRN